MQNRRDSVKVLIVGAGKAGRLLAEDIMQSEETSFEIVGFIDDGTEKQGKKISGIAVLSKIDGMADIVSRYGIEEIIIALPSERGEVVRRILLACMGHKLQFKILPRDSEILLQDFSSDYLRHIRRVKPEDLLGGLIDKKSQQQLSKRTSREVFMITGAAGSIGSELSRQIAVLGSKKLVLFDWWENGMFELRNQLLEINPEGNYQFVIGDMKDARRLHSTMREHRPTTVFHAGAYKHVPLMEENPTEAIKNNIIGTKTVAETAIRNSVKKFVLVSTDKAVNPTNVMGATKRAAEKIIHLLGAAQDKTTFCAVRFGNVVNSNGSAIPYFMKQIDNGGPVTVTHRKVTRFFMTIPEACTLILNAWSFGQNNDLFVLDMGESIEIYELAKLLIILNGYIPDDEVKLKIVGLRPGEKLYEEVLVDEEVTNVTAMDKIFRTQNFMDFDIAEFYQVLSQLQVDVMDGDGEVQHLRKQLSRLVPTYTEPESYNKT